MLSTILLVKIFVGKSQKYGSANVPTLYHHFFLVKMGIGHNIFDFYAFAIKQ